MNGTRFRIRSFHRRGTKPAWTSNACSERLAVVSLLVLPVGVCRRLDAGPKSSLDV